MATINTLDVARRLRSRGFADAQAEGLADTLEEVTGSLSTKDDLDRLEQRLKLWLGGAVAVGTGLVLAGMATATAILAATLE